MMAVCVGGSDRHLDDCWLGELSLIEDVQELKNDEKADDASIEYHQIKASSMPV